jgi:hypothetical protein
MHHPGYYRWHSWHRPSRLIWFVLGAGAATWFIKHNDMRYGHDEQRIGFCRRAPIQPPPSLQSHDWNATTGPQNPSWDQQRSRQWEEDKARLMALGQTAGDKVRVL